jgi:hypothetical protein
VEPDGRHAHLNAGSRASFRVATAAPRPFERAEEAASYFGRPGRDLEHLRPTMESAFAHDFAAVRLHFDGLADAHEARAVTIGDDVHLATSERDLSSRDTQALVAHELAHVVQQRALPGAVARTATGLEREADSAEAAVAAGRSPTVEGTGATGPQRKPKVAPAPPSGNVLYVGMNNADPEIKALLARYPSTSPVSVTVIKGTTEEKATTVGGTATYDLSTDAGVEALAKALTSDATKQAALQTLFKSQSASDRDDLAHVAKVYADTEADGKDRMTRVVLSGHSGGLGVLGSAGEVYFGALVSLASVFPKAANQTRHLIVAGCHTGDESTIVDKYVKAFPSLLTVWAWWDACPTGPGAAAAITTWASLTEHGEKTLAAQGGGIGIWSGGVYHGDPSGAAPASSVLASIRSDDARFKEYFDGTRADAGPHGGWLEAYYARASGAARRTDITGTDHDEMERNRQRAFLLRFWSNVAKNYWAAHGTAIAKGYGAATVPSFDKLSRKDALKAIGDFPATAKGSNDDKAAAAKLLDGLEKLDPKLVPEAMIRD